MNVIFIYILTFYLNLLKILIKKANHVLSNSFLKEKKKKKKKKKDIVKFVFTMLLKSYMCQDQERGANH